MNANTIKVGIDGFRLVGPLTSIGTYTEELVCALLRLGHEIVIYAPRKEEGAVLSKYEDISSCCRVITADEQLKPEASRVDLFRWNQRTLPGLMREHPCRAFVAPYHQTPCFPPKGISTLSVIHDLCGLRRDCGYRYGGRAWVNHLWNLFSASIFADRIVPISERTRSDMLRIFPFCRQRLAAPIYNSVSGRTLGSEEATRHLKPYGLPDGGFVLAFGLLSPRKAFDVAIQGYLHYRLSGGTAPIVIIGVQDEQAIKDRLPPTVADNAFLLPRISNCERDALYRVASCLLFCSRCEGFGYPVVEAMRQGCPVVASKYTPANEITAGLIELMDAPNWRQCERLIRRYTSLSSDCRQKLAADLIDRSNEFAGDQFGNAFDRELQSMIVL